jgi:serine/threonine protein kinase
MTGRFSKPGDIWSYGILLWEIATRCKERPFATVATALEAYSMLTSGNRPKLPAEASPAFFALVNECWQLEPKTRPTFHQVVDRLSTVPSYSMGVLSSSTSVSTAGRGPYFEGVVKPAASHGTQGSRRDRRNAADLSLLSVCMCRPVYWCLFSRWL